MAIKKTIWIVDYRDEAGNAKYVARQADTEAELRGLIARESPGSKVERVWLFMEPQEPAATREPSET